MARLNPFGSAAFFLAGFAYLATASHPAAFTDGLPLRPLAIIAALVLAAAWYGLGPWLTPRGSLIGAALLCGLMGAKLVVAALSPEHGLVGKYYDNSRLNGNPEPSSEFRLRNATRLDGVLDFGGDEFPLYFFNDSERFNFYGAGQPQRRQLPFSVQWDGIFVVPADGTYTFRLTASGPGSFEIGPALRLAVNAEGRDSQERSVELFAGSVPVHGTYLRRPQRSPDFRVDWLKNGAATPLASPYLRPTENGISLDQDRTLQDIARVLDIAAVVVAIGVGSMTIRTGIHRSPSLRDRSALLIHWERAVLSLAPLGFALYGTLPRLDRVGKMVYLGGGQDWLLHETLARDILIHGPLMTLGKDLGEGRAFYAQPLYPYFLALLHGLFGEDQFGPIAVQVAMLGFTCVTMWEITRLLFGRGVAWVTLGLCLGLSLIQLDWVARRLISESLYFLVLPLTLLSLIRAHQVGSLQRPTIAGLTVGLSILTRGTTLLLLPFAALLLGRRRGITPVLAFVTFTAIVVSLAPIRNIIVSGKPVLLATSGGVNMEKFHRPSDIVRLSGVDQNPIYNRFGLDKPTREVLEFIRQDPIGYLQACFILAAYTVGFGFALDEAQVPLYPDLIAYVAVYLMTTLFVARARSEEALYLHAFILIHFFAMVIFTPYDYENRLVLPMFVPMMSFVALGVVSAAQWVNRAVRKRIGSRHPLGSLRADVADGRS